MRGFTGPWAFLPLLLILTGIGFALMVGAARSVARHADLRSVRAGRGGRMYCDADREPDRLGSGDGGLQLRAAAGRDCAFGCADLPRQRPGGSDARVNLGPFQPVEAIKILLVFFLAGYFAKRWPLLRELREKRFVRGADVPASNCRRLQYALPVLIGVAVALLFFYLQKDLGPALVFACVFLALYAIARNRVPLALSGIAALLGGFLIGYFLGTPKTVHDRVAMWLSPWSNTVRGGDQVAHSLWAMASGGALGTGPGLGESDVIPAGYTDLIVSVLGEDWGFLGHRCASI